jgi:hypothetical protein
MAHTARNASPACHGIKSGVTSRLIERGVKLAASLSGLADF